MSGYGTVLVVRRQARDSDGMLIGSPVDTVFDGWDIAPVSSVENDDGGRGTRAAVTTQLQAFGGPPEYDIHAGDRVFLSVDDRTKPPRWHVEGEPDWWEPAGPEMTGGAVVTLRRVTG